MKITKTVTIDLSQEIDGQISGLEWKLEDYKNGKMSYLELRRHLRDSFKDFARALLGDQYEETY